MLGPRSSSYVGKEGFLVVLPPFPLCLPMPPPPEDVLPKPPDALLAWTEVRPAAGRPDERQRATEGDTTRPWAVPRAVPRATAEAAVAVAVAVAVATSEAERIARDGIGMGTPEEWAGQINSSDT